MQLTINLPDGYRLVSTVNEIGYSWNPGEMSNEALVHVLEYGSQRIVNDKTGGKNKTAEKKAELAKAAIARLTTTPYVRRRMGSGGLDPIVRFIRSVLRDLFDHPQFAAQKAEYKAFSESADRDAFLDSWFDEMDEQLADKVMDAAKATMAAAVKAKADKAKLVAALLPTGPLPTAPAAELIKAADVPTEAAKEVEKKKGKGK